MIKPQNGRPVNEKTPKILIFPSLFPRKRESRPTPAVSRPSSVIPGTDPGSCPRPATKPIFTTPHDSTKLRIN